jgi:uncharacterized C2H2 Zn-finger protein
MAKLKHLHKLFDAHTKDLNELLVHPEEIIACPICLKVFDRRAVDQKVVNDGHVWPKDIRKMSEKAGHMQLILCRSCNGRSGSADNQMQLHEKISEGDKLGNLYGRRKILIYGENSDDPIKIQANDIRFTESKTLRFTSRLYVYDTTDLEPILSISRGDKTVKTTILQPSEYHPGLVPAAWITSAYLMAYYTLGYKYILHPKMKLVRDYILKSFDNSNILPAIPKEEDFSFIQYEGEYVPDPMIGMLYPVERGRLAFIQVNFLSYEVRLPFAYSPSAMKFIMDHAEGYHKEKYKEQVESGESFYFGIKCTKTEAHECMYDFMMAAVKVDN